MNESRNLLRLLTRKEVASSLRMGLTHLNSLLVSGEIPSFIIGGKRLVAESDLEKYIASKRG